MPIPETARALFDRIEAFAFDEGAPMLPFHRRLARENGWSPGFAARAITEYRRFLFLAVAADHPVTPSDHVDQVWHLHLLYTRSYWERLCKAILERPLHHDPTEGGAGEGRKFEDWYARTLDSYRRFFDAEPPPDIWPPPAVRFDRPDAFVRVDTSRHFVIRRPWRPS